MGSKIELLNPHYELSDIRSHIHERCDTRELELLRELTRLLHGEFSDEEFMFSLVSEDMFSYEKFTDLEKKRLDYLKGQLPSEGPVKDLHYFVLGLEDNAEKAVQSRQKLRSQMLSLDLMVEGDEEEIFSDFYRSYA